MGFRAVYQSALGQSRSPIFVQIRKWRGVGLFMCVALALLSVVVFHGSRAKALLPLLFIAIIAIVARRFGTWAGVAGTIAATIIFSELLFEPLFSIRVADLNQRRNLVWMVIGGISLSELLGVRPPSKPVGK